jgi:hypothetical protein
MSKSYYNFVIKSSFVAWFKCASTSHPSLKRASSWYQRQFNSMLSCSFIFLSSMELLPTKIETSSIPSVTLEVFHVCHLKSCLQTFLLWVEHEILDLQEDPSFQSYSLFPLVQFCNNHEGRKWSIMMTWNNIFKEDHRWINKIDED